MTEKNKKIIVILGPTSSGKTGLAVKLARKFNGEIISADSRQVYKGMDIGTGKDLAEYEYKEKGKTVKAPYHLIDIVDPKKDFDLSKYQELASEAIARVLSRGKTPIVAGGTGLYLQAIVDGYNLPRVKPDKKLRSELEKKNFDQLYFMLSELNPKFAAKIHDSDKKNKRRLIRYIEIYGAKEKISRPEPKKSNYEFLIIGLEVPREVLFKRIYKRLIHRLEEEDMIREVEKLNNAGVSWKRLESFGLEYKHIALYLQEKMEYEEMLERLFIAIKQYAKKQMSWYHRWERQGRKINWITKISEAEKLAGKFLK
ncbi:MAG: tRNA (adenosine(37)-N6)-dimethylallyltransferase MiaA [Patescibacteria group bacterium]|jgi:tRNA dimethylallyltransferase